MSADPAPGASPEEMDASEKLFDAMKPRAGERVVMLSLSGLQRLLVQHVRLTAAPHVPPEREEAIRREERRRIAGELRASAKGLVPTGNAVSTWLLDVAADLEGR